MIGQWFIREYSPNSDSKDNNIWGLQSFGSGFAAFKKAHEDGKLFFAKLDEATDSHYINTYDGYLHRPYAIRPHPDSSEQYTIFTVKSFEVYVHKFAVTDSALSYVDPHKFLEDVGDVSQLYVMGPWLYVMYLKDSKGFVDRYRLAEGDDMFAKEHEGQWSVPLHGLFGIHCLPWLTDLEAVICHDIENMKLKLVYKDGRSDLEVPVALDEIIIPGNMQLMGRDVIFKEDAAGTGLAATKILSYNEDTKQFKLEKFLDKYTLKGGTDYGDEIVNMLGFPGDKYTLLFSGDDGLHIAETTALPS